MPCTASSMCALSIHVPLPPDRLACLGPTSRPCFENKLPAVAVAIANSAATIVTCPILNQPEHSFAYWPVSLRPSALAVAVIG